MPKSAKSVEVSLPCRLSPFRHGKFAVLETRLTGVLRGCGQTNTKAHDHFLVKTHGKDDMLKMVSQVVDLASVCSSPILVEEDFP